MWSIFVNLRLLSDPSVAIKSPVGLPVSNYPIWSPAAIALDGYSVETTNALIFDFNLVHYRGSILIQSLSIPVGRLSYTEQNDLRSRILDFPEEGVSISYNAFKYKEEDQLLGQIHISVISLKCDIEKLLQPADGNRIALQCGDYQVERCQNISPRGSMMWTSGPARRYQYPVSMIDEPIDEPGYSNPHHMLPKFVALEQQFAILNYRFTPPSVTPFMVRFGQPRIIHMATIDGKESIRRCRIARNKRYQVYSLKKKVEEKYLVTFFYIFIRSLVQIQLIELRGYK